VRPYQYWTGNLSLANYHPFNRIPINQIKKLWKIYIRLEKQMVSGIFPFVGIIFSFLVIRFSGDSYKRNCIDFLYFNFRVY
jgi:uncharacterized membrane protein